MRPLVNSTSTALTARRCTFKRMGEHPASCRDPEGCDLSYVAHLRDIAVSAHATPNRRPDVVRIDRTEARWDRDHAAYRTLVRGGVQPEKIDGSAGLERTL